MTRSPAHQPAQQPQVGAAVEPETVQEHQRDTRSADGHPTSWSPSRVKTRWVRRTRLVSKLGSGARPRGSRSRDREIAQAVWCRHRPGRAVTAVTAPRERPADMNGPGRIDRPGPSSGQRLLVGLLPLFLGLGLTARLLRLGLLGGGITLGIGLVLLGLALFWYRGRSPCRRASAWPLPPSVLGDALDPPFGSTVLTMGPPRWLFGFEG